VTVTFTPVGGACQTLLTVTPDSNGDWFAQFEVPLTAHATNTIAASDGYNNSATPLVFTLLPASLTVDPTTGPAGTPANIVGQGYPPQTGVHSLTLGGVNMLPCDPVVTDAIGSFSVDVTVPALSQGGKTVSANAGTSFASTSFLVDPGPPEPPPPTDPAALAVAPSSGPAGTPVTVTGTDFPPLSGLTTVTIGGVQVAPCCTPIVTDENGDFEVTFEAPALSQGVKTVSATVAATTVNSEFTIDPGPPQPPPPTDPATITASPSSGPVGTAVTLTGSDFPALSGLTTLTTGGVPITPRCPAVVTDDTGGFSVVFTVPGLAEGGRTVTAVVGSHAATTFFIIEPLAPSTSTQLASISEYLVIVWGYTAANGWQMYDPADPIGSDLACLVEGRGYWVKVTDDCTLVYDGHWYELAAGWNLIGWAGEDQLPPAQDGNMAAQAPGLPCRFHGTIVIDGSGAPDGTVVTATVEAETYRTTTPSAYGDSTYAIQIVPPEGIVFPDGSTVEFAIDGYPSDQSGAWETGANMVLDLTASAVPSIPGDANRDGNVNMQDVTYVELMILGFIDATAGADANLDGSVNMGDVTTIELMILGYHTPYRVGALFAVTGGASNMGVPEAQTVQMLVEQINDNGGINGFPLEIVLYDTQTDLTTTVNMGNVLIDEDNVCAIVGPTTSGNSLALIGTVNTANITVVSCGSARQIVEPIEERHWVFKTPPTEVQAIHKVYDHLQTEGITEVGIITTTDVFGTAGREGLLSNAADYGLTVVADRTFNSGASAAVVCSEVSAIMGTTAEAVVSWAGSDDSVTVVTCAESLGMSMPLYCSHAIAYAEFIQVAGTAANGVIFPSCKLQIADQLPEEDPQKDVILAYVEDYEAIYGEGTASMFGGHAYDALGMVVDTLAVVGPNRSAIRQYVENNIVVWPGISGVFTMSRDDHNGLANDSMALIQIVAGEWVWLN
jgi:branched-chain amino acid transport system substrate-binding protein